MLLVDVTLKDNFKHLPTPLLPCMSKATILVRALLPLACVAADGYHLCTLFCTQTLSSNATLTPENIKEPLRDVRRALLEADVSLSVVKSFIKRVEEKALGQQVGEGQ